MRNVVGKGREREGGGLQRGHSVACKPIVIDQGSAQGFIGAAYGVHVQSRTVRFKIHGRVS
jgi:hypothetical protein